VQANRFISASRYNYDYFKVRAAIREYEGELSKEDADWQAMNDTFYKFMEDNDKGQGSLEVNEFY
jgi:hypothetical protein